MSVPFQAIECYMSSVIPLNGNEFLCSGSSSHLCHTVPLCEAISRHVIC